MLFRMCGRYYRIEDKQAIAEYFRAEAQGDSLIYVPEYNIAPTSMQLSSARYETRKLGS